MIHNFTYAFYQPLWKELAVKFHIYWHSRNLKVLCSFQNLKLFSLIFWTLSLPLITSGKFLLQDFTLQHSWNHSQFGERWVHLHLLTPTALFMIASFQPWKSSVFVTLFLSRELHARFIVANGNGLCIILIAQNAHFLIRKIVTCICMNQSKTLRNEIK